MFIPVIAIVQFVFTLACSFLVAAGNVFFRDLGNVVGHVLRLWWFLSPGLYSLASLDQIKVFKDHAWLTTLAERQPVRDPVRGLPVGHLRNADDDHRAGRRTWPRWPPSSSGA